MRMRGQQGRPLQGDELLATHGVHSLLSYLCACPQASSIVTIACSRAAGEAENVAGRETQLRTNALHKPIRRSFETARESMYLSEHEGVIRDRTHREIYGNWS